MITGRRKAYSRLMVAYNTHDRTDRHIDMWGTVDDIFIKRVLGQMITELKLIDKKRKKSVDSKEVIPAL